MNVKLDASAAVSAYTRAFRHLTTLPGFDPKAVLKAEAGSILKKWAGVTKVTTPQQADYRARYRAGKRAFGNVAGANKNPYGISVNTGLRGGIKGLVWFRTRGTKRNGNEHHYQDVGVIRDTGQIGTLKHRHYAPADWANIIAGMEAYADSLAFQMSVAQKTIGFSRQSVVQIADQLGIDLNKVQGQGISAAGISKARAAISSSGKTYKNGFGTEGGDKIQSYVQLISTLPYAGKIGMDASLAAVVSNRAKYIEKSYEKGAFDSVKAAARAFPNILKAA